MNQISNSNISTLKKLAEKYITTNKPEPDTLTFIKEAQYTMLYCRYTTSSKYQSGWWVNIRKTCYLQDVVTNEKIILLTAINIPIAPAKYYFNKLGDSLNFLLIFPRIPKNWLAFNFVESGGSNSLSSQGIVCNHSGIYKITVS